MILDIAELKQLLDWFNFVPGDKMKLAITEVKRGLEAAEE